MNETLNKEYQDYIRHYLDKIFIIKNGEPNRHDGYWSDMEVSEIPKSIVHDIILTDYSRLQTRNGFAIISRKSDGKSNFIRARDKHIGPHWFPLVSYFDYGYARVKLDSGRFNYIDEDGELVFKDDFYNMDSLGYDRFLACQEPHKWYLIDKNGVVKSDIYYEFETLLIRKGFAMAKKIISFGRWRYVIIDNSGIEIFSSGDRGLVLKFLNKLNRGNINESFTSVNGEIFCKTIELQDYKIKEHRKDFICSNKKDRYNIKYRPFRIYDKRYTLCYDSGVVYIYDRVLNEYSPLGNIIDIEFDENFIYDNKNKKVFFIYEEKFIDLTDYYNEKLSDKKNIEVTFGIDFLSKNDFFIRREEQIKKDTKRAKEKKAKEELKKSMSQEELEMQRLQDEAEKKQKVAQILEDEALHDLIGVVEKLDKVEQMTGEKVLKQFKHLFVQVGDHLEFRKIVLLSGFLRHADLSNVPMKNVKLAGVKHLNETNIRFDPQEVAKNELGQPDLSNCNLEGIFFPVTTRFKNVNICGSSFSTDNSDRTLDINLENLSEGIYDDKTTLNGIPIVTLISEKENTARKRA